MYTYIPILAIITGGFTAVVLGFVWYSPYVFGRWWLASVRLLPEGANISVTKKYIYALLGLSASFVVAWALWMLGTLLQVTSVVSVLELGLVVWIGFVVPPLLGLVLWEQKQLGTFFIDAGYWLVTIITLAFIVTF